MNTSIYKSTVQSSFACRKLSVQLGTVSESNSSILYSPSLVSHMYILRHKHNSNSSIGFVIVC